MDFSKVTIEKLDDYLEMFYDDKMEVKVEAAKSLLFLCF